MMSGLMPVAEDTNASGSFGMGLENAGAGTSSHERIGVGVSLGRNLQGRSALSS